MEETGKEQAGRAAGGRFAAGSSGNPAGRPRGSRNRTTQLCADLLSAEAPAIFERLVKMARKGDSVALKLCVDRLLPVRAARDRTVELDLPAVRRAGDLVDAARVVIQEAAAGNITLSEARDLAALLSAERALIETTDLAVRIEALEGQIAEQQQGGGVDPPTAARVRVLLEDAHAEGRFVKR